MPSAFVLVLIWTSSLSTCNMSCLQDGKWNGKWENSTGVWQLQGDEGGNVEVQKAGEISRMLQKYLGCWGRLRLDVAIWQQSVLHLQYFYENLYPSGKNIFFLQNLFISFISLASEKNAGGCTFGSGKAVRLFQFLFQSFLIDLRSCNNNKQENKENP